MAELREDVLHGRWLYSPEEAGEGEMVLRPEGHPLPRSRGRSTLELRPDGTYLESAPGPVDRPEHSGGSWSLRDGCLILEGEGARPRRTWAIAAAEGDRLTLRP